jgi:hypothetical protein
MQLKAGGGGIETKEGACGEGLVFEMQWNAHGHEHSQKCACL